VLSKRYVYTRIPFRLVCMHIRSVVNYLVIDKGVCSSARVIVPNPVLQSAYLTFCSLYLNHTSLLSSAIGPRQRHQRISSGRHLNQKPAAGRRSSVRRQYKINEGQNGVYPIWSAQLAPIIILCQTSRGHHRRSASTFIPISKQIQRADKIGKW
jgi:hypothetical protein